MHAVPAARAAAALLAAAAAGHGSHAPAPPPAWTFRTGAVVTARPAVAAGTVYVGDWAGRVVALRLADGRPRWRFQARRSRFVYAGQIVGSPAVAKGTVYVGAGATLYALRAADGRPRWQRRLGSTRAEIKSSPTLAAGLVLVGTDVLNQPGYRAGLWALDARTGRLRWRFDAEAGRPPRGCGDVWSSPTVDLARRTVYVGTGSCNRPRRGWTPYTEALVALDLDTGRPRWAFQPHRPGNHDLDFAARPNLFRAGGRPLVGIGGKDGVYYALTPAGRLVWKQRLTRPDPQPGNASGILAPAAVAGGTIVVASFGDPPSLHALDAASGRIRWQANAAPIYGAPAIAGRTVLATDTAGVLRALDLGSGRPLWQTRLPGGSAGGPTIAGHALLVPYGFHLPGSGVTTPRAGIAAFHHTPSTG